MDCWAYWACLAGRKINIGTPYGYNGQMCVRAQTARKIRVRVEVRFYVVTRRGGKSPTRRVGSLHRLRDIDWRGKQQPSPRPEIPSLPGRLELLPTPPRNAPKHQAAQAKSNPALKKPFPTPRQFLLPLPPSLPTRTFGPALFFANTLCA